MNTTYTYDRASLLDAARHMAASMLSGESLAACAQESEYSADDAAESLWDYWAEELDGSSVYPKTLCESQHDEFREAVLSEMTRRIVAARG